LASAGERRRHHAAAGEAWAIRTEVDVVALLEKPKQLPPPADSSRAM
jgi:hypothetical protein